MHVAYSYIDVILTGYVLQGKRVRRTRSFGQKGVPQSMKSGIGVRLDLFPQFPNLAFGLNLRSNPRWLPISRSDRSA